MSSKSGSGKQSRIALKKLRDLGLYKGDLRKKPTKYALSKIAQFDDVLKGKATVVAPKNPGRFKNLFPTVGKLVVVPRRKGERISVDKSGEIVSKRKSGKHIISARGKSVKRGEKIPKPEPDRYVQYVIPFNSRDGVTWFRFPSWDELQKFMAGYDYKGWEDYVIEEDVNNEFDDDELDARLERKRKGRRIKGGLPKTVKTKSKAKKKSAKKTKRGKR